MPVRPEPPPLAVLDANVLLQAPLRDTLLRAAEAILYVPCWGRTILAEVERNLPALIRRHPDPGERAARLVRQLQVAFPRALSEDDPAILPPTVVGPARHQVHPGDAHVAAAARHAGAGTIVTYNVRHFPPAALGPLQIVAMLPDQFLLRLQARHSREFVAILTEQGAALHPPRTLAEILDVLAPAAPRFVAAIRQQSGSA